MKKILSAVLILAAATASAVDFSPVNVGGILSVAGKQDTLPYDTNAIPWSAIAQKPDIPKSSITNGLASEEWVTSKHYLAGDVTNGYDSVFSTNLVYIATNGLATTNYVNDAIPISLPNPYAILFANPGQGGQRPFFGDELMYFYAGANLSFSGTTGGIILDATVPAAQVNSDWDETDTTSKAYILHKPTIPSVYLASASATDDSITVTDNGGAETSLTVQYDYGITNLTGTSVSLASGQIGEATVSTNLALALDFAQAADRSGDCLLYVYNSDGAADHYITPTNAYHYVSSDLAAALKLAKATTNIVMFSRLTSDTVLVSKQEVK